MVWENDGSGTYTSLQTEDVGDTTCLAAFDVDGDLDVDLVFGTAGAGAAVFLNDGAGTFTDSAQVLGSASLTDLAPYDVDSDGDLDFVASADTIGFEVWVNDGAGSFTLALTTGAADSAALLVEDLEDDGDPDVIAGNSGGAPNRVHLHD